MPVNFAVMFPGTGALPFGLAAAPGVNIEAIYEPTRECMANIKAHFSDAGLFDTLNQFIDYGVKENDEINALAARVRGRNWQFIKRVIENRKFDFIVIEGLAILRSRGIVQIMQDFWSLGYHAEWHIIPASSLGAPYKGERLWLVAHPLATGRKASGQSAPSEGILGHKYLTHDVLNEYRAWPERIGRETGGAIPSKPGILRRNDRLARRVDAARVRLLSDDASPLTANFVAFALLKGGTKGNRDVCADEIVSDCNLSDVQKRRNFSVNRRKLDTARVEYTTRNNGLHFVVPFGKQLIDFWPSTGHWRIRGQKKTNVGLETLLAHVSKSC